MAVIARAEVTISLAVDVERVEPWYTLSRSTLAPPTKPSVADPSSLGWSRTEPTYDGEDTMTLYSCMCTTLTDGTFYWGSVTASSAYESVKRVTNRVSEMRTEFDALELKVSEKTTVAQVAKAIEAAGDLIYDHTYAKVGSSYVFTASLRRNGEDVTDQYDPDRFVWYLRDEGGDTLLARGVTMTVDEADVDLRTSVIGGFEDDGAFVDTRLVDDGGRALVTDEDVALVARIIWED